MNRILCLSVLLVVFTSLGSAVTVGAAPGSIDFGSVEPGETVEQEVYIRAPDASQNFTVNPSASGVGSTTLFSGSVQNKNQISEQNAVPWFEFRNTVINPNSTVPRSDIQLSGIPEVHGAFTVNLEVPEDAEPGFRYGTINLNPAFNSLNQSGSGARVLTPTSVSYSLRVEGRVDRDLEVTDVRGFRTGENSASVEVLITNEGSVTTSTQDFEVDLLDSRRNVVDTLTVSWVELEPGESEWTNAVWNGNDVEEGEYQVDGEVDYFTGQAYASGGFELGDIVTVEEAPSDSPVSDGGTERDTVPMWLVFMVLAILAVLMWSFDIEPFWIMAIVGGLAVSSFILLSGVSNYLLVVLLMAVGIIVYGVM